jgi:asparagine synthase (glutamine-hydrolysing)
MLARMQRRLQSLMDPKLAAADAAMFGALHAKGLTYLTPVRAAVLVDELARAAGAGAPGAVLEFGVAGGGSAVLLAQHARRLGRPFMGFDLFGQIPPPGPNDPPEAHQRHAEIRAGKSQGLNGAGYYGYETDLRGKVSALLASHGAPVDGTGVSLVQGLFEETVPSRLPGQVAFAHVDCDWYDPVKLCLAELAPRMAKGAVLVLDDYADWEGCRRAADEFLAANPAFRMTRRTPNAVIRRAA